MTSHLPQSNATLLLVARDSGTENYTLVEKIPTPKWEGEVDAYVNQRIMSGFNQAGELNRTLAVDIIIPSDLEPATTVEAGDTIEYGQWDPSIGELRKYRARVQAFSTPANLPGLPYETKIALEKISATP